MATVHPTTPPESRNSNLGTWLLVGLGIVVLVIALLSLGTTDEGVIEERARYDFENEAEAPLYDEQYGVEEPRVEPDRGIIGDSPAAERITE